MIRSAQLDNEAPEQMERLFEAYRSGDTERAAALLSQLPVAERDEAEEMLAGLSLLGPLPHATVDNTALPSGLLSRIEQIQAPRRRRALLEQSLRGLRAAGDGLLDQVRGLLSAGVPGAAVRESSLVFGRDLTTSLRMQAPIYQDASAAGYSGEEENDALAGETLRKLGLVTAPIDMDAAAAGLNLALYAADLEGYEGCLVTDGEVGVVVTSAATVNPRRRRFTIAHEIAHFLLHADEPVFKDTLTSMVDPTQAHELEANALAAHLLMPGFLLDQAVGDEPLTLSLCERISREFDVSLMAAAKRLVRRGGRSMLAVFHNGTVEQRDCRADLTPALNPGDAWPAGCLAASLADSAAGDELAGPARPDAWFATETGSTAREMSRKLEEGYTYTLIVLD